MVGHKAYDGTIEAGDGRGLRGRADACVYTAQDDQRHQQRKNGSQEGLPQSPPGKHLVNFIAAPSGDDIRQNAQRRRAEHTGDHACHQQLRNRCPGNISIDHEHNAGRNNDAQSPGYRTQRRGIGTGISPFHHLRMHDTSNRRCSSNSGAGDRRKNSTGNNGHDGKSAFQPAHQGIAEITKAPGKTAPGHDISAQKEAGDCQKCKVVQAQEHLLGHDRQNQIRLQHQAGDASAHHRPYDRKPQQNPAHHNN